MTDTVLFDLGGTLVQYYERSEFPAILEQATAEVRHYLRQKGLLSVSPEIMWRGVREEDHEARDYHVRPLEERLVRVFQLDPVQATGIVATMCRCFMKPIFARGRCYQDTLPTLQALRARNFKTAIISNTPWGSPANLWREEIARLGLSELVPAVVFCRDVGWRKPAKRIFQFALEQLQVLPQHCLFVGDDPRWDLSGPRAVGMEAVLIDRRSPLSCGQRTQGATHDAGEDAMRTLHELWPKLQPYRPERRVA